MANIAHLGAIGIFVMSVKENLNSMKSSYVRESCTSLEPV